MLENLQGFHIEPTNICTLKCSKCARTNFIEKFPQKWKNYNLNLQDLKEFLDIDLNNKLISLNGNYGDPLYYPDLIPLVTYFKTKGCRIIIHTNGSYVKETVWQQLADVLNKEDIINFSIDGIPENFTQYRVNADWASIERGINIMTKSRAKTVWKFIVFSYNISDIHAAKLISDEMGFDDFVVNNSDRWDGPDDWLNPKKIIDVNEPLINGLLSTGSFDSRRTKNIIKWKNNDRENDIDPLCKLTNSLHFISAEGFYLPCCWAGDHRFYYQSEFYKHKEKFAISKTTLSKVLDYLQNFFNTIEITKPKYCTFNCSKI